MTRRAPVLFVATLALVACSGFREAMTAHVDVVARAGSQELSVDRLASLLAHSKAPLQKDVARQVADVWVDYQLLGRAAAHNDSLNSAADEDQALWAILGQAKARKLFEELAKQRGGDDTAAYAKKYADGEILSAKHILLLAPRGDTSKAALDSVRRKAEALRAKVTPANFAQMAQENSQDPGSARRGGDLSVFQKGQMVPEFEQALLATPPGQIHSGVVKTQFGYHIIYRPTYDEVKTNVAQVAGSKTRQAAESAYFAHLDTSGKITIKPNAASTAKAVATDIDAHRTDKTVLATSVGGDFTAGRLSQWLSLFPAPQRAQLTQLPDSAVPSIIRNFVHNELVLREADSAKLTVDSAQSNEIKRNYQQIITGAWTALGIDPKQLSDSAKTVTARERLAASHVEAYLDKLLTQTPGVRFVDVPSPVEQLLKTKYESQINEAGIDRALARATAERHASDSTRAAKEPPSAVPLPGAIPGGSSAPAPAPGSVKKP